MNMFKKNPGTHGHDVGARVLHVTMSIVAVLCFAAPVAVAAPFGDGFGIASFDGGVWEADGSAFTQAGGHPFEASTTLVVNGAGIPGAVSGETPDGNLRDVHVSLPKGLIGNPLAVPSCTENNLEATETGLTNCPSASQVGVATVELPNGPLGIFAVPVYNMDAPPNAPAAFGFNVAGQAIVHLVPKLRSAGDYGIDIDSLGTSQAVDLKSVKITLWGVPFDPAHDVLRAPIGSGVVCLGQGDTANPLCFGGGASVDLAPRPFLTLPTDCSSGPVPTTVRADSWQRPGDDKLASFVSHDEHGVPVGTTGCERLPFTPTVAVDPTASSPDAPVGLDVTIESPQNLQSPKGLAAGQLKDVTVTLPDGMTINPSAANGLQACSDTQLGLGVDGAAACPDSSRIGRAQATTPLLADALTGAVYVGTQKSDDPASGDMFRVLLVLQNAARGVRVKLVGNVRADQATGRLTATFANNPQLPVSEIRLALKSGPRAPLVTPPTCGPKAVESTLTSWSGKAVDHRSAFAIDCAAGLGGFGPSVSAGARIPVSGAFSPFSLSLRKPDGDAAVNGLRLDLPSGLLARLKGNLGTQVGTVKAFAGPGSSPFVLPGQVYLEGRYGDAPFSLRVVVAAKAGPFDLGIVEVRQKIYADPIDAHVTVVSDPIPTIVKGVPVRLQRLDVDVDKAGFMINPTSCAAKTIGGTLGAVDGQSAPINVRFQVGDCASLALKPSLALSLSGKGQTTDGKHPAISATLTQPVGQANLEQVRVSLPLSLALDPDNANSDGLCSFVEGSKPDPKCPASSAVGRATAVSPILDKPLSGPVYFVKNERKDPKSGRSIKTTPKLVIPLTGENGVKLTLTGVSSVPDNEHLVTTFDAIPDAPVSSFKLDINGGKKGILVVSDADICKATQIADQQIDGQNGKTADADVYIQTPSCRTKIISKTIGKSTVKLKIGGLGAGKVTVTGRGFRKTTKAIAKSTVATITAKRTGKIKPGGFKVKFTKAKGAATA